MYNWVDPLVQLFSNFSMCQNCQMGLLKQIAGHRSENVWFNRSGAGLRICISDKLPDETDVAGLWTTLWEPLINGTACEGERVESIWSSGIYPTNQ